MSSDDKLDRCIEDFQEFLNKYRPDKEFFEQYKEPEYLDSEDSEDSESNFEKKSKLLCNNILNITIPKSYFNFSAKECLEYKELSKYFPYEISDIILKYLTEVRIEWDRNYDSTNIYLLVNNNISGIKYFVSNDDFTLYKLLIYKNNKNIREMGFFKYYHDDDPWDIPFEKELLYDKKYNGNIKKEISYSRNGFRGIDYERTVNSNTFNISLDVEMNKTIFKIIRYKNKIKVFENTFTFQQVEKGYKLISSSIFRKNIFEKGHKLISSSIFRKNISK
jgi:hypothetical protein